MTKLAFHFFIFRKIHSKYWHALKLERNNNNFYKPLVEQMKMSQTLHISVYLFIFENITWFFVIRISVFGVVLVLWRFDKNISVPLYCAFAFFVFDTFCLYHAILANKIMNTALDTLYSLSSLWKLIKKVIKKLL